MKTRTLLLAALVIASVGVVAIFAVAAADAETRPMQLLLVAIALATIVALAIIATLWARAASAATRKRSTRLSNLERRAAALVERIDVLEKQGVAREQELIALREVSSARPAATAAKASPEPSLTAVTTSLVLVGRSQGLDLTDFLTPAQAVEQLRAAAGEDRALDALPFLEAFPEATSELSLSEMRTLLKGFRRLGYLSRAVALIEDIADRFDNPSDARAAEIYASELALYRGEVDLGVELPPLENELQSNVVLHFVGKALPDTQSGYTLRTQYTVEAQRRLGIEPIVVAQAGAGDRTLAHTETYEHRGIRYYLLGGPKRGSVRWDEWLRVNIGALAEVVRSVRPAAIHTHSDFMNAMIARPVATAYGIPMVNETRGFWEESWLSRTTAAEGWPDVDALERQYGLPDMYGLRVEREAATRASSDAVVTLARVMREHIERVGDRLSLPVPATSIAPNAVEAADFPVRAGDVELRERLGIEPDAIVIGYISSIVEYEGIDTLVRAAFELNAALEVARSIEMPVADQQPLGSETADANRPVAVDAEESAAGPASLAALRASIASSSAVFGEEVGAPEAVVDAIDPERETALDALAARLRLVHLTEDDEQLRERAEELLAAVGSFSTSPLRLLVVGDGAELRNLRELADELGLDRALFPGRVPHDSVLDYYSLIDLFIVPRKRAAVTELVTPLKPFEAMATGRPCLFSDVGALAEIAADSGCVELFRADDHHDLALTAGRLLSDPAHLAQMSKDGAEWVRNERTWDMNALTYLAVYRSLGLNLEVPPAAAELQRLRDEGIGARTLVQRLARGADPEPTGWFLLESKRYSAAKIKNEGWKIAKHPPIRFEAGMDWEMAGRENRSWGFHLHAWEFIDPALQEYAETRDEDLLRWMLDVAMDWWAAVEGVPSEQTMAWYDMSLSLRMPRLARLIIATAKSSLSQEAVRLIAPALEHMRRAQEDVAFNPGNNHGFFAAAAALDFARWLAPLPGTQELRELGDARMRTMLARQFGADGGHLEHSPDYHRMLLHSFERALQEGLIEDAGTAQRIERAARVLGWLVQPDGNLVQFGDSPRFDVEANELTSIDPHTTFLLTDGESGLPEDREMLVLPDTGYAIVRSPQPAMQGERLRSSYLAFQGGFHSRAHKHADDLSFTWFDRGHEVLVDAGRFGYIDLLPTDSPDRLKGFYYSAPERQYVESTMAHNTVQVDGRDIERRSRKPYGSALGECLQFDGRFELNAEVDHGHYRHRRTLSLTPREKLSVLDRIEPSGEAVDAIAWFNMPGEADLEVHDGRVLVHLPNGERLTVSSAGELVPPVRGQQEPLRGWRSLTDRELVPTWSFGFRAVSDGDVSLVTEFVFADDDPRQV